MSMRRVTPPQVLAVLVIVGVTTAFIWPVFQPPNHDYRRSCLSPEKQIGLALTQYIQDNDDTMPSVVDVSSVRSTWRRSLLPYLNHGLLFHCPGRETNTTGPDGFASDYAASASRNAAFAVVGEKPRALTSFPNPATTITSIEATGVDRPDFNIDGAAVINHLWAGHRAQSNYIVADGHAKSMPPLARYQVDASGKVIENEWYRDGKKPLFANGQALLRRAQTEF